MARAPEVEFFFCLSCLSSYLALTRLRETVLRTGAAVSFRPVVSAWLPEGIIDAQVRVDTATHPVIRDYRRKDLNDWARFCGLRIECEEAPPVDTELAQRAAVAAVDAGRIADYTEAMFRARFEEGRNIADRAVVADVAIRSGLGQRAIRSAIEADYAESVLRRNLAALVQRGGFTTPTMFLADDMYVGHERVPLLELALMRSAERPLIAPGQHQP